MDNNFTNINKSNNRLSQHMFVVFKEHNHFNNLIVDLSGLCHNLVISSDEIQDTHNGQRARLKCRRSWVRAPIGSNQRFVFVASPLSMQH